MYSLGNYDFALDLSTENSLSVLLTYIKKGSRVLELGPANGRLTRYLKEAMECTVDIVEIDAAAGQEAAQYAKHACLGAPEGDIDGDAWALKLKDERYDFILFADVLEHLRSPEKALRRSKELLKEAGSILVSVPNIAHNAILLSLMAGKFEYADVGLLDRTHVHFFTRDSFHRMAAAVGCAIISERDTTADVAHAGIPEASPSIAPRSVRRFLLQNPNGTAFQYIFRLVPIDSALAKERETHLHGAPGYALHAECFVQERGKDGFDERCKAVQALGAVHFGSRKKLRFDLTGFHDPAAIRFDPLEFNGVVRYHEISFVYDAESLRAEITRTNGERLYDTYLYASDDPQAELAIPKPCPKALVVDYTIGIFDDEILPAMIAGVQAEREAYTARVQAEYNRLQAQIAEMAKVIANRDDQLAEWRQIWQNPRRLLRRAASLIKRKLSGGAPDSAAGK